MSSTAIGTVGSVQRGIREDGLGSPSPVPPSQLTDHAMRADIAELAYVLWEEHGCRGGSAEGDWLEAERRMQESRVKQNTWWGSL
jgi:hypothetical protein